MINKKTKKLSFRNISIGQEVTSEHALQKLCVKRLRYHNFLCFCTDVFNGISFLKDIRSKSVYKQHMIAMGASVGCPDLIILRKGKVTFVEFKFAKGKKSPEQIAQCKILESLGYEVLEWRTEQDCIDWIVKEIDFNKKKNNEVAENSTAE